MQIVIEIPEEMWERIKDGYVPLGISKYLKNGTPLPKGHGRLIDADELEECKEIMETCSGESKFAVRMEDIRNMPTIIGADKESEDKG